MVQRRRPGSFLSRLASGEARWSGRRPPEAAGPGEHTWKILGTGVSTSLVLASLLGGLALLVRSLRDVDLDLELELHRRPEGAGGEPGASGLSSGRTS